MDLEETLRKCQEGNRALNRRITELLIEKNSLRNNIEECNNSIASIRETNSKLQKENEDLKAEVRRLLDVISNWTGQVSSSTLCDKKAPALLKALTDPKTETIYRSGLGMKYNGTQYFYYFKKDCVPIHIGGVAFDFVLDRNFFIAGMKPKEVFDKALEIVQKGYGYKTDTSLYGPMDSWAPPDMTNLLKYGDCEDLSMFVVNIFLTYELIYGPFKDYYCGVGVGYMSGYCHAFPVLMHTLSTKWEDSFIGEATLSGYQPSKTIESLKDTYIMSLGLVGLPIPGNATGGFVVRKEWRYWKEGSGGNPGSEPKVSGEVKEKKKKLKEVWGNE